MKLKAENIAGTTHAAPVGWLMAQRDGNVWFSTDAGVSWDLYQPVTGMTKGEQLQSLDYIPSTGLVAITTRARIATNRMDGTGWTISENGAEQRPAADGAAPGGGQ